MDKHSRLALIPALLLLAALSLAGCGSGAGHAAGETLFGGAESDSANLYAANLQTTRGGEERIVLDFNQVALGQAEDLPDPPFYFIDMLSCPDRLYISFEGLYTISANLEQTLSGLGLVRQAFVKQPGQSGVTALIVQLSQSCLFNASSDGSRLTIRLRAASAGLEEEAYTIVADAFDIFDRDDRALRQMGLYPSLTQNGLSKLLVSSCFGDEASARAELEKISAEYEKAAPGRAVWIQKRAASELPSAEDQAATMPIDQNGDLGQLYEFFPGRMLDILPETQTMLFARRTEENQAAFDQLWLREENGIARLMLPYEFSAVSGAVFSQSGRRAIIAEDAESGGVVYLYDIGSNALINLTDSGVEGTFRAASWIGETAYLLMDDQDTTLWQYTEDTLRAVILNIGEVTDMNACEGMLYFSGAQITAMNANTGEAHQIAAGGLAEFSPSNIYFAALSTSESSGLEIFERATGQAVASVTGGSIRSAAWDTDEKTLYFLQDEAGGQALYTLSIGQNSLAQIGLLPKGALLHSSPKQGQLVVQTLGDDGLYRCFLLDAQTTG